MRRDFFDKKRKVISEHISTAEEYILDISPQQLIFPKDGKLEMTITNVSEEKQDILIWLHATRLELEEPRGITDTESQVVGTLAKGEALTASIVLRDLSKIVKRDKRRSGRDKRRQTYNDSRIGVYCFNHDDPEKGLWLYHNSEKEMIDPTLRESSYWSEHITMDEEIWRKHLDVLRASKVKIEEKKEEPAITKKESSKKESEEKDVQKPMKNSMTLDSAESTENVGKEEKVKESTTTKEESKELSKVGTPEKMSHVETGQPESVSQPVQSQPTPQRNPIIKGGQAKKKKKKKRGCCVIS